MDINRLAASILRFVTKPFREKTRSELLSEWGRRGGYAVHKNHPPEVMKERARKGGQSRWEGVSPEERTAHMRMLGFKLGAIRRQKKARKATWM